MKITRNVLLVCLALSISAFGQFGRLGDLAKKAKQKPNTDVQRCGGGGTPEAVSSSADTNVITGGETKVVTFTINNACGRVFDQAESGGCLKVDKVESVSESQVKLTVFADERASDGNCSIELKDKKGFTVSAQIKVKHKPRPGENFRPEQLSLAQAFASQFTLKMPGGQTEVLTRVKQVQGGNYEYKDSKGKWYTVMYMQEMLMFSGSYGNQCSYTAGSNSKHEALFTPLSNACGFAIGQNIEATWQ